MTILRGILSPWNREDSASRHPEPAAPCRGALVRRARHVLVAGSVSILVAACSSSPDQGPGGKRVMDGTAGGMYKVGRPYKINGVWYYPEVDYSYDRTGIASWYGPGFHGKSTANGEIYDQNDLTAAHPTLPMPSVVHVTNLDNGRTLKLRINDRGPFHDGRIIDVSRRAAQLLGFYGQGLARVRVRIEAEESRQIAEALTGGSVEPAMAFASMHTESAGRDPATKASAVASLPAAAPEKVEHVSGQPVPSADAPTVGSGRPETAGEAGGRTFIQAGAFADPANAVRAQVRLEDVGEVQVSSLTIDGRELYRVRVGPFASGEEAIEALAAARRQGYAGSRLVFD